MIFVQSGGNVPVAGEGLGVCGQTGCVPAVVTSELSAQVVRGHTLAEGACRDQTIEMPVSTSAREKSITR